MEQMNLKRIVKYDSSSTVIFQSTFYSDESLYANFAYYQWEEKLYISRYGSIEY